MTLTGFIVELDTTERIDGYHDCTVIAMPSDPPSLTIWVSYISVFAVVFMSSVITDFPSLRCHC